MLPFKTLTNDFRRPVPLFLNPALASRKVQVQASQGREAAEVWVLELLLIVVSSHLFGDPGD